VAVTIGSKKESSFADPIGLLTDCHRRIERFLSVLVRVCKQAPSRAPTGEEQAALENALRYFREAAPKHTADEEETLFPRLRAAERPELAGILGALEEDHARADRNHGEVDRLARTWLDSGSLPPADANELSCLVEELAELYREHIAIEERELFPAAAAGLESAEREAMGREMAARRGLSHE
jgi:hemerythrin-like domain-containing protein